MRYKIYMGTSLPLYSERWTEKLDINAVGMHIIKLLTDGSYCNDFIQNADINDIDNYWLWILKGYSLSHDQVVLDMSRDVDWGC